MLTRMKTRLPRPPAYTSRFLNLDRSPANATPLEWLFNKKSTAATLASAFIASAALMSDGVSDTRSITLPFVVAAIALTAGRFAERKTFCHDMDYLQKYFLFDTQPSSGYYPASNSDIDVLKIKTQRHMLKNVLTVAGMNGISYWLYGPNGLSIMLPATTLIATEVGLDTFALKNVQTKKWNLIRRDHATNLASHAP